MIKETYNNGSVLPTDGRDCGTPRPYNRLEPVRVSVVVPVYGVERFVERCVRGLMEQTLREGVEFIFVDDATPDGSMEIVRKTIADYPDRASQVKILTHESNRGLPTARNTGMDAARGEWVCHIDSDDFPECDMLESQLAEAERSGADMVWCDWYLTGENSERPMPQPSISDAREATVAMLGGAMKYNVWNKLTRRSIFTDNNIRFPDGHAMGEDMTMIMAATCCQKTAHVARPLYHYRRTNTAAMTQAYSERHLVDLRFNVERTADFVLSHDPAMAAEMDFFKLQVKFPFLLMRPRRRGWQLWREWWPEANRRIGENHHMSGHSRVAQRCAAIGLRPLVALYAMALEMIQKR